MTLRPQKYSQLVNASGDEEFDQYGYGLLRRIWFMVNKQHKQIITEGIAAWRQTGNTQVMNDGAYTLLEWDEQEYKSQNIRIWKSATHKFYAGKKGFYEFNVNWRSGIGDLVIIKPMNTSLACSKNGAVSPSDDFVVLDGTDLCGDVVGMATGTIYHGLSHLQGTKLFWLEPDTDYVEFFFWHESNVNLGNETSHTGFVEVKYLGTEARRLL